MRASVETNKGIQQVEYRFINEDTIECTDIHTGEVFTTYYKSMIV